MSSTHQPKSVPAGESSLLEAESSLSVHNQLNNYQKALTELKRIPRIPGSALSFFGNDVVHKLVQVLTSPEIIDIDALILSNQFTHEAFIQYLNMLPETLQASQRISEVVDLFMMRLRLQYRSIVKATVRSDKKNGLLYFYNQLHRLVHSFRAPITIPFRASLVNEFMEVLLIRFFDQIEPVFQQIEGHQGADCFLKLSQRFGDHWYEQNHIGFPPEIYFRDKRNIQTCLTNPLFLHNLTAAFPPLFLSTQEKSSLEQTFLYQFLEISDLSQFRRIIFTPWKSGGAQMAIMGDESTPVPGSGVGICSGMITVNPLEDLEIPQYFRTKGGREAITLKCREGVICMSLSRCSGELCLFGQHHVGLSEILPEEYYLPIKKKFFEMLLEYLRNKEPDIDDLFSKFIPPVREPMVETRAAVSEAIVDEVEESPPVEKFDWRVYLPPKAEPKPSEISSLENIPSEYSPAISLQEKNALILKLKGLRGLKVLGALKRLLGEPIRIQGSHHIFKSNRTGKTLPIPIRLSDEVKFFFLQKNLRAWGITLEEFCDAL